MRPTIGDGPPAEYVEGDLDATSFRRPTASSRWARRRCARGIRSRSSTCRPSRGNTRRGGDRELDADSTACRAGRRTGAGSRSSLATSRSITRTRTSSWAARTPRRSRARCSRTTRRSTRSAIGESEHTFLELSTVCRRGAAPASPAPRTAWATASRPAPEARRHRGLDGARVAARLLRHAHRDDLARLPLAPARSAARRRAGGAATAGSRSRTCSTRSSGRRARSP
jgi:hypothetical protein